MDTPLHPFALELDLLDQMLNFEIADDPHYTGLEIQSFNDAIHGTGTVVFFNRRDNGKTDVYYESSLKLDPNNYAIGNGLGQWIETEFDKSILAVTPEGVRADVGFTDAAGRPIEVRAADRTPRGRRTAAFLAPMGAAIAEPTSLRLIWMAKFDLMRRSGPEPVVAIDGRVAALGHLPVEWLTRRRLIKVTSDLCAIAFNPAHEHPVPLAVPSDTHTVAAKGGTGAIVGKAGGHEVRVEFEPPFPDLRHQPQPAVGNWTISIDDQPTTGGTWTLRTEGAQLGVDLHVTERWKPRRLPLLMRIVTRVAPVFRTWPTTYRWRSDISPSLMMTSSWERTDNDGGASYRKMTGSD